jgi:hypothetical protein
MARITVTLDGDVVALVDGIPRKGGLSRSQWLAETVKREVRREWPTAVTELVGAWPDFSSAEDIRWHWDSEKT